MSTNASPERATERDNHADLESADAAPREPWESGRSIDDLADEIRERAKTPRSEYLAHDEVVARVMAKIASYKS